MAAKKSTNEELLLLPRLKDCCPKNVKQKFGEKFGNFGTYIMLPDPELNLNAFYGVKRICKFVCEWYSTWRPWQREVLLCSLSAKCSVSQLSSLSTILEPVFHRDFVSRLHGKYPTKDLEEKLVHNKKSAQKEKKEDSGKRRNRTNKFPLIEKLKGNAQQKEPQETRECDDELTMPGNDSSEGQISDRSELIKKDQKYERNFDNIISLTDLVKQSVMNTNADDKSQDRQWPSKRLGVPSQEGSADHLMSTMPSLNSDEVDQGKSYHVHTANVYQQQSGWRFFSASHLKTLNEMKATLPHDHKYCLRQQVSDLDQRCYKHKRWWSEPKTSRLVSAHSFKLWTHFTRQLREINKVNICLQFKCSLFKLTCIFAACIYADMCMYTQAM